MGLSRVPEGLKVKTLFQIPFHRFASVRWLNSWLISPIDQVVEVVRGHQESDQLVHDSPCPFTRGVYGRRGFGLLLH